MAVTAVLELKITQVPQVTQVLHQEQLLLIQNVICLLEEILHLEVVVIQEQGPLVVVIQEVPVGLVEYFYMRTQEFNHGIFNF
jgi:hypothetical protein